MLLLCDTDFAREECVWIHPLCYKLSDRTVFVSKIMAILEEKSYSLGNRRDEIGRQRTSVQRFPLSYLLLAILLRYDMRKTFRDCAYHVVTLTRGLSMNALCLLSNRWSV